MLDDIPGIAGAITLGRNEALKLLQPWLGEGFDGGGLPLPVLIDVQLEPGKTLDLEALRTSLSAAVPDARVESREGWLAPLIATADTIRTLAYAVVALIGLAAVATVVFTTSTSLAAHQDAIELLHLTGAYDGFIAQQFQRQALIHGLLGGLTGLALAGGSYVLVARVAARMAAPLLPRLSLDPLGLAILASLPLAAAGLATIVARLTVLRALSRLP
ncbi:MAG: cell division protein [Alphaproteobacteria bacterium]|nr:cell division protein [Alphaproteobacteria bacterium]